MEIKSSKYQFSAYNLLTNVYILLFIIFILLALELLSTKMIIDEGIWSYIGRVWHRNDIKPYQGTVENKTPGIFYLYTVSDILFGINIYFPRGLGLLCILSSAIVLYHISSKLHSKVAGVLCVYFFGLSITWGELFDTYSMQTEMPMIFFSILTFFMLLKGKEHKKWKTWIMSAGFSMGIAIAFKQIAITTSAAAVFFILIYTAENLSQKNKLIGLFYYFLGIIIATLFSLIPLFISGVSFKEYINGAWLILLNPGSGNYSLYRRVMGFYFNFIKSRLVIFYPILALLFWNKSLLKEKYFIALSIWLLFDFAGTNASGNAYGHQMIQLLPPISVMSAILLANFLRQFQDTEIKFKFYLSIILVSILLIMFPYKEMINLEKRPYAHAKEIGTWVKNHTDKDQYIYVFGHLRFDNVLSYSERISSSKYFNPFFITSNYEREILFNDLLKKPPAYIFLSRRENLTGMYGSDVMNFVATNYKLIQPWIHGPVSANKIYDYGFDLMQRN